MKKKSLEDTLEPVNALIDITDSQLDDQLLELEKLTTIDSGNSSMTNPPTTSDNLLELLDSSVDLFSSNTFDADWSSAFGSTSSNELPTTINRNDSLTSSNDFLPSSLLNELLSSTNKSNSSPNSVKEKSNWLDLFAELDPIQNPDAIGKSSGIEFDRNC